MLNTINDEDIIARLKSALAEDRVVPWFQAVMDPAGVTLISVEALPRLEDPERGIIAAGELIEPAIRHGLLGALSERLLLKTAKAHAAWQARKIAPAQTTINLTGQELQDAAIVDRIRAALDAAGIQPSQMAIEVLETTATEPGCERALASIDRLHDMGLGFILDDFGAHACDPVSLRRMHVSSAKVDRAIISRLGRDESAKTQVAKLAEIAKELGILMIAKGVESRVQIDILSAVGCDGQQGFAIARPAPEDSFSEWLDLNTF